MTPQVVRKFFFLQFLFRIAMLFVSGTVSAQTDQASCIQGSPRIIHYSRKDFNSDPQIWTMCQDKNGILYFGSNKGALIYDGETWQNVKLPNNSSVRSLAVSKEGIVYAGGFNEFGTIKKDGYGNYFYESWLNLLRTEDRNIENIWGIHEVQGHMVFRSYRMLIAIADNKAVTLPASEMYDYSTVLSEKLFVNDGKKIKQVDLQSLELNVVAGQDNMNDETVVALLPGYRDQQILVITKQGSLFALDPVNKKITFKESFIQRNSNNRITCAIKAAGGDYYLGTLSSKVTSFINPDAVASFKEVFQDLQDNTVLNLFESSEGNIWALLNNGIDCIDVSSPVTRLFDTASIFDVLLHDEKMYLATNLGVLAATPKTPGRIYKEDFKSIPGIEGQTWSLQEFDDYVLCSHDDGVIVISKNGHKTISGAKGVWKTMAIKGKPGYFLVCTYSGLFLMKFDKARGFEILHRIEGFDESTRDILQSDEPGVFWVCHGYKGVFKIKIDPDFKRLVGLEHFKDKNGLPSPFNINVFQWNNEIVFTTNKGIFVYNADKNEFKPHPFLTKVFGTDQNVRQLLQFGNKTWFVQHDEVGYFLTDSTDPQLFKGLFLQLKGTLNESMECIVPVNNDNVLVGTREALYSFDLAYTPSSANTKTLITAASYTTDSDVVKCQLNESDNFSQSLPYQTTKVKFSFSAPGFDDKLNIQYSYKIEGISEYWSAWNENSSVEYNLLHPGKYTFHVKARSLLGEQANEARYHFEIIPVWYKTNLAYTIFILAALSLIAFIAKSVQRRIEHVRRKTIAEETKKRKALELEIQHFKLEREREQIIKDKELLEEDVIFKSKELANYTMLLVKKRELLSDISEDLKDLKEVVRNDQARQTVRELQRKISINLNSEEHLKIFEANFERVHNEFFAQLKCNFPDLTQKELQLCAFVKMNLTNKEIASILNLSVRGIETARYRLRKRLGMDHAEDMAGFLDNLYSSADPVPEL